MERLTEMLSVDLGVVGQSINNGNVTGRYFKMQRRQRMVAIAIGGAQAATKTTKIEWLQATDEAGTSSKSVASSAATGTSGTKDTAATIALASVANTDVVEVNGVSFTKAAAEDTDANEFDDAESLKDQINTDVPGVVATVDGTTVTVTAKDGYTITLGKTENAGTITLATTQHLVISEVGDEQIDAANGFLYVAPKITATGNGIYAVVIIRDSKVQPVSQYAQALTQL